MPEISDVNVAAIVGIVIGVLVAITVIGLCIWLYIRTQNASPATGPPVSKNSQQVEVVRPAYPPPYSEAPPAYPPPYSEAPPAYPPQYQPQYPGPPIAEPSYAPQYQQPAYYPPGGA
jgi:hypothetical protein